MAILFSSFLSLSFILLCFIGYLRPPVSFWCSTVALFRCVCLCVCVLSLVEPSVICYAIMFIARFISFVPLSPRSGRRKCSRYVLRVHIFYRPSITQSSVVHLLGERNYLFSLSHRCSYSLSQQTWKYKWN